MTCDICKRKTSKLGPVFEDNTRSVAKICPKCQKHFMDMARLFPPVSHPTAVH